MHIAAMKPVYTTEQDIPAEVRQQVLDEAQDLKPDKVLKKFIKRDVLMDQDFAMSDKYKNVKNYIDASGRELKTKLDINEWILFSIQ